MVIENGKLVWKNLAGIWWNMSYKNGLLSKSDDKIYKSQVCFGAVLQIQLKTKKLRICNTKKSTVKFRMLSFKAKIIIEK